MIKGYRWELYHVDENPTEYNDLAATMPAKLSKMQDLFYTEAKKYDVLPHDNSTLARFLTPRPSATAGRTHFTYSGELNGVPASAAPNILAKDFTIEAEVEIPDGGAEGMIVTEGGRFGGYGLLLSKGELGVGRGKFVFLYNLLNLKRTIWENPGLNAGKHTIRFDFTYDGPGFGKGGTGTPAVDGKEVATNTLEHSTPILFPEDGNDANTLRTDALFKLGVDRKPLDAASDLASAPTFSCLENAATARDVYRMAKAFVDQFIASYAKPPTVIVLDMDHSEDATHARLGHLLIIHDWLGTQRHITLFREGVALSALQKTFRFSASIHPSVVILKPIGPFLLVKKSQAGINTPAFTLMTGHPWWVYETSGPNGKSAIRIFREYLQVKRDFTGRYFWAREYCVSSVEFDEQLIREYIKNQKRKEIR